MKLALRRWPYALAVILALLAASLPPDIFRQGSPTPDDPPASSPPGGRVTVLPGGAPLPGASVRAVGPGTVVETTTGPDGRFRFDPVPAGATEVIVRFGPLLARAPWRESGLDVAMSGEYSVGGRIVDAGTGEAVPGAAVAVGAASMAVDDRGRFRIAGLLLEGGGIPTIRVSADGYAGVDLVPGPADAWDDLFLRLVRK